MLDNSQKAPASNSDSFQTFIPTKNMSALLSYYFSLGAFVPYLGIGFGVTAIVLSVKGLRQFSVNPTPGAKGHAIFAIIFAGVMLLLHLAFIILIVLSIATEK